MTLQCADREHGDSSAHGSMQRLRMQAKRLGHSVSMRHSGSSARAGGWRRSQNDNGLPSGNCSGQVQIAVCDRT